MDLVRPFAGPLFRSYRGLTEVPELAPSVLDSETRVGVNFCLSMMKLNNLQQYRTVRYLPLNDGGYGALHVAVTPGQFGQPLVRSWLEVARKAVTVSEEEEEKKKEIRTYTSGLFFLVEADEETPTPYKAKGTSWFLEPNPAVAMNGSVIAQVGDWRIVEVSKEVMAWNPDIEWVERPPFEEYPRAPLAKEVQVIDWWDEMVYTFYTPDGELWEDIPSYAEPHDWSAVGSLYYSYETQLAKYFTNLRTYDVYWNYCELSDGGMGHDATGSQLDYNTWTSPLSRRLGLFMNLIDDQFGSGGPCGCEAVRAGTDCWEYTATFTHTCVVKKAPYTKDTEGTALFSVTRETYWLDPFIMLPGKVTGGDAGILMYLPAQSYPEEFPLSTAGMRVWGIANGEATELTDAISADAKLQAIVEAMGQEYVDGDLHTEYFWSHYIPPDLSGGMPSNPFRPTRSHAFPPATP